MTPDEAFQRLQCGVQSSRVSQAYLIVAPPRGIGMTFAERYLSLFFCEDQEKPCESCRGCKSIKSHTNPDVLWVEPHKKSRIISKEQLEEVRQRIFQTSYAGGWKVCVFVSADRLNPSAANSLLKALEEPPPKTLFLLLTDNPQSLLPTVISRSQKIVLSSADQELIDPEVREKLLTILSASSGRTTVGRLAKSEQVTTLLQKIKKEVEKVVEKEMKNEDIDVSKDAFDARVGTKYREKRTDIMHSLLLWYRDILIAFSDGEDSELYYSDMIETTKRLASGITYRQALTNVRTIENMNRQLAMNMQDSIVFTNGFSQLC
ncbi:hypothetical protein H8D64_01115 [PVC group bacterium]|nr:hypothetical protein [PVC group bacterium]